MTAENETEAAKGAGALVPVGQILRPQGRRGELLADPLTDQFEIFRPSQIFQLTVSPPKLSQRSTVTLESSWQPQGRKAGRIVLKFAGVDSIADAEALEGATLHLRSDELPALAPDTFFVRDLLGCELLNGDLSLGLVTDIQFPIGADGRTRLQDAVDLLEITPQLAPSPEPFLVPFVKAWLVSVDLDARRITMHLPEGLFDVP